MYCLDICSICFINQKDLINLSVRKKNGLTYLEKLILTIPEMDIDDNDTKKQICNQCMNKIEDFYLFRRKCLKSQMLFKRYEEQLDSVNDVLGKAKVNLVDIAVNNEYIDPKMERFKNETSEVTFSELDDNIDEFSLYLLTSEIVKTELSDDENMESFIESNKHEETYSTNYENDENLPFYFDVMENPELEIIPSHTVNAGETTCVTISKKNRRKSRNKAIYTCNICFRQFGYQSNLQRHQLSHSELLPLSCNACSVTFEKPTDLTEHQENCPQVLKQVEQNSRSSHNETYNCNFCEKTYTSKLGLQKHIRNHMGFKPYVCTICRKCFNCSSHLKVHSRTHSGEKPYQCSVCLKGFADNSNLTKHLVKFHS